MAITPHAFRSAHANLTPSLRTRQPMLFALPGPLAARLGAACFAELPESPGVYRFHDRDGALLYIGQSFNLRARVGSYRYVSEGSHARRTVRMVTRAYRVEWEPCLTTAAAIAMEARLLVEHTPPFNRAGVWHAPPCWLVLDPQEGVLHLRLTRAPPEDDPKVLGPLPPGFGYTFAPLIRCLYRSLWPETGWWNLPCGMARPIIAPEQSIPLPPHGEDIGADSLRRFIAQGCPETLTTLTSWTASLILLKILRKTNYLTFDEYRMILSDEGTSPSGGQQPLLPHQRAPQREKQAAVGGIGSA